MNNKRLYSSEGVLGAAFPNLNYISVSLSEEFGASPDCMLLQGLQVLEELEICGCAEMADLPPSLDTLSSLKILKIDNCRKLETLPYWLKNLESLRVMSLFGCPSLQYISEDRSWHILLKISEGTRKYRDIEIYVKGCPKLSTQSSDLWAGDDSDEYIDYEAGYDDGASGF